MALANMPLNYTEGCNSDVELCTDHFQKSVDMSTYLVAFVVCDFNSITSKTRKGVQVSVWAPPEQIDQGQFALDVAVKVLEYYEQIFKVDYPLPKQDLIAIPDFSAGAMENWGLITYRLTSLLYDEGKSSDSNKQWVAVVVAHELAHQWFGNLVTMEWWNDLWLNEGFASFMENVGVRHVRPEWKMMDQFFLSKFQVAMGLDQLSNSHPIMAEVRDPAEISSLFDSISYDKGAAIIRMLEDVLGSKLFFQGLQNYLNKYKFSNAETNDLWQCLTDEVKESGVSLDVTEMMTTWTSQMGFPVIDVTVERDANGNMRLQYRQERFLVHPGTSSPSDSAYRWVIPLTYVTQQNPSKRHVELLKRQADNVLLRGVSPNTVGNFWIKMNAGQSGYYRVNYDEGNWNSLKEQLNSDHTQLIGADRAGLLDDALNLARAGNLSYNLALDLTAYLSKEQEYVPWISALNGMAYFASQFSTYDMEKNTQYYRIYKLYILIQIHRIASELGWKETDLDPHLKRYLRATILHLASDYEDVFPDDRPYTKEALRQFDGWLNRGESIRPNLRNVVYSLGVKYADIKTWQKVFERFRKEQVATEKRKLMYALTSSRNPQILKSFLQDSLDPKKIRSQDSVSVINSIAHNPEGRLLAWEFVQKNYDLLFKRYGKGSFEFSRLIKATTAHFNTETKLREVKKFFKDKDTGSGKLALLQSLESIEANVKWLNAHRLTVVAWLKNFVSSHVHSPVDSPHHHVHVTSLDERYKYGRP